MNFTENELKRAAETVRDAMLSSLPEPDECSPNFSPAFTARMGELFAAHRRKEKVLQALQTAAAVLITVLMLSSVYVLSNEDARAAVIKWTKETFGIGTVYRFYGDSDVWTLPKYKLTWLPEGFELVDEYEDEVMYSALYFDELTEETVIFEYYELSEDVILSLLPDKESYSSERIQINGIYADLYYSEEFSDGNLIIIDEEHNVVFSVNANTDKSVILHIGEGIKLCNPTN